MIEWHVCKLTCFSKIGLLSMSVCRYVYLVLSTSYNNTTTLHVYTITKPSLHYNIPSLTTDMVDSPMYAVINNSMGSGNVTYECEGHETRLSDCMTSTIAPCYYALVKCTTDKKSGGSTTSGSSAGIVAVVVVVLLVVITIVLIIILIVWLKRRDKNLKPTGSNANNTSPQSPQSPPAVTGGTEANDVTLALGNPTYTPTHFQPAQTDGTPEHKFSNPLYSTASEAGVNIN